MTKAMTAQTFAPPSPEVTLYQKLEKAVRRVCPDWLRAQEDDLVQVSMMRVMEVQKKSEGNHELSSSYLWSVAHSAMIDEIRRHRRRQEVSMVDDEGNELELPALSSGPDAALHARQIGIGIRGCLEKIMKSRCLPLTLYLQGYSVPESAETLGWTVKKVENLVYRGLHELRSCLESKGLKP